MKNEQDQAQQTATLRQRAEEIAQENSDFSPQVVAGLSAAEISHTLHELRVHQIELQMQNEELIRAQQALRESEASFRALAEELREANESLANFFAHSVLGMYRSSFDGRPLLLNPAQISMLGYASFEELLQAYEQRMEPKAEINPVYSRARFLKEIEEKGQIVGLESPWLKPNGELVTLRESAWIAFDAAGKPKYYEGIFEDITERKRLEIENAELEVLNHQLHKSESLGRMAGSIAHHFNNKLQAVLSNLDLLSALPKDHDPSKLLAMARLATEKAAEMSRLMLLYLGQTTLERKACFLSEICQNSLPIFEHSLPVTVTLETDLPSPGPVVEANADQFGQVLDALLRNGLEALADTGGQLRLGIKMISAAEIPSTGRFPIRWQPQAAEYACLEVTDNGCGIADADIKRLFDPFFSTKFIGRGLGLSVALGIVQAHSGAITVASQPSQGSVFRVYLPLIFEAMPSLPKPGLWASKPKGRVSILVVDDDEMLRESVGAMLERLGFQVFTAQDGVEAVEVFEQHLGEIRCLLTDLTMPRMDGWETLTALRQLDPFLPVILASGYDKAQVLAGFHPELPQVFLGKPFSLNQLKDALGQAMAAISD